MAIYVSGSLAFDRIMTFDGNFQDHVITDKLNMLNVCFLVSSMDERRGGCGGNISYTLALLGEKPVLVSSAGKDFSAYGQHLIRHEISLEAVSIDESRFTATCCITTDKKGNQITGFYPGAMATPSTYAFPRLCSWDIAIVSPGCMDDMLRLPSLYREKGVRFIFDPGQQLPLFSKETLTACVQGAFIYICNEYELEMTCRTMETREEDMLSHTEWLVTTLAEKGVRVRGRDGTDVTIPAAICDKVVDPTGAGDSQRAGLLLGLSRGLSVPDAAKIGAVSASFAIECLGTQEHHFTPAEFTARYEESFGSMLIEL